MAFEGRYRETQRGGFGSGAASTEPTEGGAASTIQELESDLSKLQEYIDCIGTPLDSKTNRAEIKRLRGDIKTKVTSTKAELKSARKSQSPQQKILADRQASQLEGQISKFQRLLDKEKTAVKQHPQPDAETSNAMLQREDMVSPSAQSQTMSQMQRMDELEEREQEREELHQLETDILDLNDIQKDMAQLVHEQGQDINRIDKNVSQAAVRVESGTKQTTIAVKLKRRGRRIKVIIAVVVGSVILAVLVVLAILLGVFIPRGNNDNLLP